MSQRPALVFGIRFAVTVLALLVSGSGIASAATDALTPHGGCLYTFAPHASAVEAFGNTIDDPRTLAFVSLVEGANTIAQDAIVDHAANAGPIYGSDEIEPAIHRNCADLELESRTARLDAAIAKRWNPAASAALASATRLALGSLLIDERASQPGFVGKPLPPLLVDATLATFDTTVQSLDRMLAQPIDSATARPLPDPHAPNATRDPCNAPAGVVDAISPEYTELAILGHAQGTVAVTISLDPHGFVRSATLDERSPAAARPGGEDLIAESIVAAGVSTYAPAFAACKAIPGTFVFRANFTGT